MVNEGVLFGLGNPLLDISASVTPEFLAKYGLKENDQILADEKHENLYKDMVSEFKVSYIPGGATQNAIRVAQWMLGVPKATTFTGCIGRDEFGKILEEKIEEEGVKAFYKYSDDVKTGTCAVCITESKGLRSLVAYLGAANHFTKDHLKAGNNWQLVEKADFFYTAGFPLTVCPDAMLEIAEYACLNNKVFCLNLSAPFICQYFKEHLDKILPYTDYLFGNESEFLAYAEENKLQTKNLKEIAVAVSSLPKKNHKRERVVLITQGDEPTIVARDCKVHQFPILKLKATDLVDTNGAGDAFTGGFLACLVKKCSLEKCIDGANYAANYIIQQSGIQLPTKSTFTF